MLGSFLEHLGRAINTGVYEPGSRTADAKGFRTDVAREVKDLGVPIIRYPGGNFVSGTTGWTASVRAQRPVVLDRAWNPLETNQFGTNEFIDWCGLVNAEPLLGMNFGTGTVEAAVAYVDTAISTAARGGASSDARTATIAIHELNQEQAHNTTRSLSYPCDRRSSLHRVPRSRLQYST